MNVVNLRANIDQNCYRMLAERGAPAALRSPTGYAPPAPSPTWKTTTQRSHCRLSHLKPISLMGCASPHRGWGEKVRICSKRQIDQ